MQVFVHAVHAKQITTLKIRSTIRLMHLQTCIYTASAYILHTGSVFAPFVCTFTKIVASQSYNIIKRRGEVIILFAQLS